MEHFYQDVRGWFDWQALYAEVVRRAPEDRPSAFVEVGAYLGKSTAFLAVEIVNSGKVIRFDVVDTWRGSREHQHCRAVRAGTLYQQFLLNLAPVRWVVNPVALPSVEAARHYRDGALDFVFIDGSHDLKDVRADIAAWRPKVRPGGVIAGHDVGNSRVAVAVREAFGGLPYAQWSETPSCWSHEDGRQ